MTAITNISKSFSSILSNLNNFHSPEVVDRVSETHLQGMSIVAELDNGWILDSSDTSDTNDNNRYHGNNVFFEIWDTFQMDTAYEAQQAKQNTSQEQTPKKQKRRKRKNDVTAGEAALQEYHDKICGFIQRFLGEMNKMQADLPVFAGFRPLTSNNNQAAREAAKTLSGPGDTLHQLCHMSLDVDIQQFNSVNITSDDCVDGVIDGRDLQLVDVVVHHTCSQTSLFKWLNMTFLLPPLTSFLLSDVTRLQPLIDGKSYDVIVLDPPWQNKSVKRKKTYNTLSEYDITRLPIPKLASPGCLLAIWMTNKKAQRHLVTDVLLPRWRATLITHWYWLKVTKQGKPVCDLSSPHKKPYEVLLLARVEENKIEETDCNVGGTVTDPDDKEDGTLQKQTPPLPSLPHDKVMVSVPCSIHSRKPPSNEVLLPYLPVGARCLEMFARNLLPGWTSWGNEVLKHQHLDYFEETQ